MALKPQNNYSLKRHNSFGFDQCAECYIAVSTDEQLVEALQYAATNHQAVFILGGGSNLVLTKDIPGLVVQPNFTQIEYQYNQERTEVLVSVGAGVNWNTLVLQTLKNNAQGLENLTLIPGSVGAAPVQNIGAYGVEVKDRIESVQALHIPSLQWRDFSVEECQFSYRHSFFKQHPGDYVITGVRFKLTQPA